MPTSGQGAQGEHHPVAEGLGDPRSGGQEDEVRHGDGEAVGADGLPAALRTDQGGDRGAPGDREDTEPDPPDRGEREDHPELVAEREQDARDAQEHQSHGEHRPPPEAPQGARDQQLGQHREQQQHAVHESGPGGGRPAFDRPQRSDREQQRVSGESRARHHHQRRHARLTPDRPPCVHGRQSSDGRVTRLRRRWVEPTDHLSPWGTARARRHVVATSGRPGPGVQEAGARATPPLTADGCPP